MAKTPISYNWLKRCGFKHKWTSRVLTRPVTTYVAGHGESADDVLTVTVHPATTHPGSWSVWLDLKNARAWFPCRMIRTKDELRNLIEALTGTPFDRG